MAVFLCMITVKLSILYHNDCFIHVLVPNTDNINIDTNIITYSFIMCTNINNIIFALLQTLLFIT